VQEHFEKLLTGYATPKVKLIVWFQSVAVEIAATAYIILSESLG
jgi:hypothetical protein